MTNTCNCTTKIAALDNYGDLLTVKNLSEIFFASKQTIYREIQKGVFGTPVMMGRQYLFPKGYIVERYLTGYKNHN